MGDKHAAGSKNDHKNFSWLKAKKQAIPLMIISIVFLFTVTITAAEPDNTIDNDVFNLQIESMAPPADRTCPTCPIGVGAGVPGYPSPEGFGPYAPSGRYGSSRIPELTYTREILKMNTPIISSFFSYMFPPGFGVPDLEVFSPPPARTLPPGPPPITNASKAKNIQ
ncbi:hypothetical protein CUJ83_02880 [Methanocella sp. CWC-04]|uniref:Uncharacterized protein n=1 Tax=Methanooceanicella nereidis TaxID=2052831 RepID=A0AAP2W479_9EURY|nr:hypothetical protein [Methanocella sp. CWC-04]MCD1293940.1 hypothetical protein [Methanocella sp. CWC-04]